MGADLNPPLDLEESPSPYPLPPGARVFGPPPSTGGGRGRVATYWNNKVDSVKLAPIRRSLGTRKYIITPA
jgi:hypothetical protein